MYESHFGFTGSPFRLNPDPAFYFGSRGHSNPPSYLKFGVFQNEGFVVVTGDIGTGKSTLVRTLPAGLESAEIGAAQIVSTQLDAGDLCARLHLLSASRRRTFPRRSSLRRSARCSWPSNQPGLFGWRCSRLPRCLRCRLLPVPHS